MQRPQEGLGLVGVCEDRCRVCKGRGRVGEDGRPRLDELRQRRRVSAETPGSKPNPLVPSLIPPGDSPSSHRCEGLLLLFALQ